MQRRPVTRLHLLLLCGVLAGCGGESSDSRPAPATSTTTSTAGDADRAEWVRGADRLCARVAREVVALDVQARGEALQKEGLSEPDLMRGLAPLFEEQRAAIERFAKALEGLGPPPRDTERELIEATREAERELAAAVSAMREGKSEDANDSLQRYAALSQKSAEAAAATGDYSICGSGS